MFLKDQPLATGACSVYPYSEGLKELLTLTGKYDEEILPLYRELDTAGGGKLLLVPRGLAPVGLQDYRTEGRDASFSSVFQARNEEQTRFIDETVALLRDGDNFISRAPTGFGKTACGMEVIAQVGKKTLIVVTKEDIKDQWVKAAGDFLNLSSQHIGIIQGDDCDVAHDLCIAMIHSMGKLERYPKEVWQDFGLVIWDECHRIGAEMFSNSGWVVPAKRRWGLSATPHRKDGKDLLLTAHIGPIKVTTDLMWLKPKIIVKKSKFKLPRVPRNGAWVPLPHEHGRVMHVNKLLADDFSRNCMMLDFVLEAYKKERRTIIFSDIKAHLETLHDLLRTNGIFIGDLGYYVGGMTEKQREVAKKKKVILATYKMASEATNIPWLDTAVFATPHADVEQIAGRILREWEDKKEPVIFDIVDEDSNVFCDYFKARMKYYKRVASSIIGVD